MAEIGREPRNLQNRVQHLPGAPTNDEIDQRVERFDEILQRAKARTATSGLGLDIGSEQRNSLHNPTALDLVGTRPQSEDYGDSSLSVSLNEQFSFNMNLIAQKTTALQKAQQGPNIPDQFQEDVKTFSEGRPFTEEQLNFKVEAFASYAASMHNTARGTDNEQIQAQSYLRMNFVMMAHVKVLKTYHNEAALNSLVDGMQSLESNNHPQARELQQQHENFFVNVLEGTPARLGDSNAPMTIPTSDIPNRLIDTLKVRFAMSLEISSSVRNVVSRLSPQLRNDIQNLAMMNANNENDEMMEEIEEESSELRAQEIETEEETKAEELTDEQRSAAEQLAVTDIVEGDT